MANDLNFDELDKAVHTYMQKKDTAVPTPTPAPTQEPVATPPSAPATISVSSPAEPASPPAPATPAKPVEPPITHPVSTPRSRLQLRTRQSIASRRGASGSTFHDIMPNHRHSTVTPNKHLTPLNDVVAPSTPIPPAKTPLPEEAKKPVADLAAPTVTDIKPPETPAISDPSPEVKPKDTSPVESPKPSEETPKILGDTTAIPEPSDVPEKADAASTDTKVEEKSSEDDLLVRPDSSSNSAVSDALLEDLRKESEAAAKTAPVETPKEEKGEKPATEETSPKESETPPATKDAVMPKEDAASTKGLLSETPLELEDSKTDMPAPQAKNDATTGHGLLDTGELHNSTPASPVDTSHMLKAGGDDPQSMQVFDTKEYHTPIATHEAAKPKGKKWEITIIVLVVLIVVAAGFVAYMMVFSGK